jgi:hypothetical protein
MYQNVRVESEDGHVLGAAILVAEDLLLTCAHLTAPQSAMKITFPGLPGEVAVKAKPCTRWRQLGDHGDIALLEITEPRTLPAGVRPCRFASLDALVPRGDLSSFTLTAVGFPGSMRSEGVHATVATNANRWLESEWLQIDVREEHLQHLDNGFSGAAVRLPSDDVVGMVTDAVNPRRQGYVGKMLPLRTIRRYWPGIVDRLPDEPPDLPRDLPAYLVDGPTRATPEQIFRLAFPEFVAVPTFVSVWDAAMYAHDNAVVPGALHRFLTTLAAHVDDPAKRARLREGLARWHLPKGEAASSSSINSIVIRADRRTKGAQLSVTCTALAAGTVVEQASQPAAVHPDLFRTTVANALPLLTHWLYDQDWMIEFVVPQKLMSERFDEWDYQEAGRPQHLRSRLLVVRDVERLGESAMAGDALRRWQFLRARGDIKPTPVSSGRQEYDYQMFRNWLDDEEDVCVLVFDTVPKSAWLLAALDIGIPIMLWFRHEHDVPHPPDLLTWLVDKIKGTHPDEVPHTVRRLRRKAWSPTAAELDHYARQLTLFWDDPARHTNPPPLVMGVP